jgi:ABC-2 type transport system permease protein
MSGFTNIVKKELRELLTRSTVLPIVLMALMFGLLGNAFSGIEDEIKAPPKLGIVNMDEGILAQIAVSQIENLSEVQYNGTDINLALDTVDQNGGTAVLVIPANFTSQVMGGSRGSVEIYWIMRGAGLADSVSSASVETVLSTASASISAYLIENNSSANASIVLYPTSHTDTTIFRSKEMNGISPTEISSMLSGQSTIVPIIIMMIVMMAGSTIVSSMGMEKENKTLETLLTLPVRRSSIIAGKLAAAAIVGLLMAGVYMVGFGYYMQSLSAGQNIDLGAYGLSLGVIDYVLVGLSLFASLLAALALCMVIGTFATSYKSAQTLIMPIMILTMIPMFVLMMKDFNTLPPMGQAVIYAIPFSHPMMAFRSLMFDDYLLVVSGILYSTLFAVVMIAVASWIFKTDRLLTGRIGKKAKVQRDLAGLISGFMVKRRKA